VGRRTGRGVVVDAGYRHKNFEVADWATTWIRDLLSVDEERLLAPFNDDYAADYTRTTRGTQMRGGER
jgi:hypothetical protein